MIHKIKAWVRQLVLLFKYRIHANRKEKIAKIIFDEIVRQGLTDIHPAAIGMIANRAAERLIYNSNCGKTKGK